MIKSLSINFIIRGSGPIITYLVLLLNGRYINDTILGEIILGISIMKVLQSFSLLGFPSLIIRNLYSNYSYNKSNVLKYLISFQTVIVIIFYFIFSKIFNFNILYFVFSIPLILGNYFSLKLRANDQITIYNLVQTLSLPITQLILLIIYTNFYELNYKQYLFFYIYLLF